MNTQFVSTTIIGRSLYVTLNNLEKRNALSPGLIEELKQLLSENAENEEVRVVVIRAKGDVFSAGADLAYLQSLQTNTYEENLEDSKKLMDLFLKMMQYPKLIIAQVQGHAIAGGCGLATVCDLVYAVPEAKFAYTEVKIGFIPALVSVFLKQKIGGQLARELLLTGKMFDAASAYQMGLINGVIKANEIEEFVRTKADEIADTTSGASIAASKQLLFDTDTMPIAEAMLYAAKANAIARSSDGCKKGIASFLNKEKLKW